MAETFRRTLDVSPSSQTRETYYIGGNSGKVTTIDFGEVTNPKNKFFIDISFQGVEAYQRAEKLGQFFYKHEALFHIFTRKISHPKNEVGFVLTASVRGKDELLENLFGSLTKQP